MSHTATGISEECLNTNHIDLGDPFAGNFTILLVRAVRSASRPGAVLKADPSLNTDLIVGAEAIADSSSVTRRRRRIYHLFEEGHLPLFRLGAVICGRKSILWR